MGKIVWNRPDHEGSPTTESPEARRRNDAENKRLATVANSAPRVPWEDFVDNVLQWKSGEHFGLIGPTGQGKTNMLFNLLPLHPYVAVFATKPADSSMDELVDAGYVKLDRWKSLSAKDVPRRVIWPNARKIDSQSEQREVFHDAFAKIYIEGNWTLAIDELWFFDQVLKLSGDIKMFLLQARSLGISLVSATQRPAWVPRELYTSCTHLMFWRTNDETDLSSISGIGWKSSTIIKDIVSSLDMYQVLYINTRTGYMCRTKTPPPPREEVTEND